MVQTHPQTHRPTRRQTRPARVEALHSDTAAKRVTAVPRALRDSLAAAGVEITDDVEQAAAVLVAGTLAPKSRARYRWSLGVVARWCAEHRLELLHLTPLDIAALAVAVRDSGLDPDETITALSFVYRHKREPCESATTLARRVDKVWRAQNREQLVPHRRAPVLPLRCWVAMHAAVGRPGYLKHAHDLNEERLARDKLVISLGLLGGLRPGELGMLSASASRINNAGRLVLPLVAGSARAVTKTGQSEIIVPVGRAPFDVLPLAEDFERLRAMRLARREADDHLIAGAWHYRMRGGLTEGQVQNVLRKTAQKAGIAEGTSLSGHSMRRSMVHISVAAGWALEAVAAVLGHASTRELENAYLEGYCGSWSTGEGREPLLEGTQGWADWPINTPADTGADPNAPVLPPRWWAGRDLNADRARAMTLARATTRVGRDTASRTARARRLWEGFCADVRADPARPSQGLLWAFATSLAEDSTASRVNYIRFLNDHFAALPSTDIGDLALIESWVSAAAKLAGSITAANRKRARIASARRQIQTVTDDTMERLFAVPLVSATEAIRLCGLVIEQGEAHIDLTRSQRNTFRFDEHTRITPARAELFAPASASPDAAERRGRLAVSVAPRGGDPLWCGYEAVRTLAVRYPDKSLRSNMPPQAWASRCGALLGWLEARAAVAVLYATGLRPSDLDGFRWSDLAGDGEGSIMWRLPYSKGNLSGDRVQVLRLVRCDRPWCAVSALRRLAGSAAPQKSKASYVPASTVATRSKRTPQEASMNTPPNRSLPP